MTKKTQSKRRPKRSNSSASADRLTSRLPPSAWPVLPAIGSRSIRPTVHQLGTYRGAGNVDVDTTAAITIRGHSKLCTLVINTGTSALGLIENSQGSGFSNSALTPGLFHVSMSFLYGIFDSYERYRFRRIKAYFVPYLPTTFRGQIAFAIRPAARSAANISTNATEIQNSICSTVTSCYTPAELPMYNYNGARVFTCANDGTNDYQLSLECCMTDNIQNASGTNLNTGQTVGSLYFDYELDLFSPKSSVGTPGVALQRFHALLTPEQRTLVRPLLTELSRITAPSPVQLPSVAPELDYLVVDPPAPSGAPGASGYTLSSVRR